MANELGITGESFVARSPEDVDGIERQGPVTPTPFRKVWELVAITVSKAWFTVAYLVKTICSIITSHEPFDLHLIWKLPLCLVFRVVLYLFIISSKWNRVFILSCIAISLDPLFLYIPIIDEANQCLGMDKVLRNITLGFRSFTDIIFVCHIILLITDEMDGPRSDDSNDSQPSQEVSCWPLKFIRDVIADKMSGLFISVVISCLAVLPIPQVAILVVFFKMNGTKHSFIRSMINIALLFQFVIRICQMYLSSSKVGKVANWVYGSLYFFLYILASHVFAAFWYFFSIQQVVSCWRQTCRNSGGCINNYNCGGNTSNSKLLNSCSISSPNATSFDLGMYIGILQSGITGSTNFPKKFFYSFWWGLKNLSNFGTNLETSNSVWENCFAIAVCITGLLLFLYLIGNVQLYIQMYMQTKAEKLAKTEEANHEFMENWMTSHGLHDDDMKAVIKREAAKTKAWELANTRVDASFVMDFVRETSSIFYLLVKKWNGMNPLHVVRIDALKKISGFENVDERVLEKLCVWSGPNPVQCPERLCKDYCIIRAGEQLSSVWLILDGVINCEDGAEITATGSSPIKTLNPGDYYGVELLRWAILNCNRSYRDPFPISNFNLTCQRDGIAIELIVADYLVETLRELGDDFEPLEAWALDYNNLSTNVDDLAGQDDNQLPRIGAWKYPDRGWLKLNCSCVWDPDSKLAELGWVLRDDAGAFIAAASIGPLSCMDMFFADALAVRKAIEFCSRSIAFSDSMRETFNAEHFDYDEEDRFKKRRSKVAMKIVVESDNQLLIDCLNDPQSSCDRCADVLQPIIAGIVWDASAFEAVTFVYCEREFCNAAAHNVAKHAMHDDPQHLSEWHSTPPGWLTSALDHDLVQKDSPAAASAFKHKTNMIKKKKDIIDWLSRNSVPTHLKTDIMNTINKDLIVENNIDAEVDVEFIFSVLPKNIYKSLRFHLGMNSLKKVPMLKSMHGYVLEIICCHLEPVIYEENSFIVREGEGLGFMIFILQGTIIPIETTNNDTATNSSGITEVRDEKIIKEGSFYGEQLLSWASPNNLSFSDHPVISPVNLKCGTKVEALTLKAKDLRGAVAKCGSQWKFKSSSDLKQLVGDETDRVADKSALASTSTNNEQTIQLHQGHDMIMEQLVLIRETMFRGIDDQRQRLDEIVSNMATYGQRLDEQGRRLDEMAAFLATSGYKGTSCPPSP